MGNELYNELYHENQKVPEKLETETTQKFSGLADVYAAGRPAYPDSFIDVLYSQYGFSEESVIADVASGTGKFARLLLERGSFVYCVEPNNDMRKRAAKELSGYKNVRIINGTDVQTSLEDGSVDCITAAQAFHWFNSVLFRRECRRILKNCGMVFLIWNLRDMQSKINQCSFRIFTRYCPDFRGFGGGIQKNDIRIRQFFDGEYEYKEFDYPLHYITKEAFISRCLSGSYSLKRGDCEFNQYLEALSKLYDQYEADGVLTVPNKTVVYLGTLK